MCYFMTSLEVLLREKKLRASVNVNLVKMQINASADLFRHGNWKRNMHPAAKQDNNAKSVGANIQVEEPKRRKIHAKK